jgi:hypothetical protein
MRVMQECQVELLQVKWENARQVTIVLRKIVAKAGAILTSKMMTRNVATSRAYTIQR